MDSYSVIVRPHVSEKTNDQVDKNNEISFVVLRESNKNEIKKAFKHLFDEEVERVNTHINPKGLKIASIKLSEPGKADDIAIRIGIF